MRCIQIHAKPSVLGIDSRWIYVFQPHGYAANPRNRKFPSLFLMSNLSYVTVISHAQLSKYSFGELLLDEGNNFTDDFMGALLYLKQ